MAAATSVAQAQAMQRSAAIAGGQTGEFRVNILGERNPRGIPAMRFIENVGSLVEAESTTAEELIQALYTMHSKYKFMENQMLENRQRMRMKIPEIERSLEMLRTLEDRREREEKLVTHFPLADNVYAKAQVPAENTVCLWLGANVMVEYSYAEARKLLEDNLNTAKEKLEQYQHDLDFVREQAIITQVNISRTFNFEVQQRKAQEQEKIAS